MPSRLFLGFAALLLAVPTGLAYSYSQTVLGPRTVNTGSGYPVSSAGSFDVSDISTSTNYVSGTCNVKHVVSSFFGTGPFAYVCGTDRDNDGLVTNIDASSTGANHKNDLSTDSDGYDDDFTNEVHVARGAQGSTAVCFRADVDSSGSSGGYPTTAVWDAFYVFIPINTAGTLGRFKVDVVVSDTANGGCVPSAHTHASWL